VRFEIRIPRGDWEQFVEADGVPPDEMYPEYFVDDDGWIYPAGAVAAFRRLMGPP
jgi:hypothetical protein